MEPVNKLEGGIVTSGTRVSYWIESATLPVTQSLDQNIETEVVIVGGGLAGLSIAYCLTQAGRKVVLVEDGFIGSGETGRTTAQLCTALDERYYELENMFGFENAKLIAESHRAAIGFVEQTIKKESIDCDFERVNAYLFLHPSDTYDSLKKELEAATRVGIKVTELEQVPALPAEGKCLCFANQAQFHPLKYLSGLCQAIEENGGKLFTETHISEINHTEITTSKGFTIKAGHIVVATNAPVNSKYLPMLKQWAYRTYVIGALVKKNVLPKALWWDTGDQAVKDNPPYHYVRLQAYNDTHDLLLCGGEDHGVGDTSFKKDKYVLLEEWARERFPVEEVVSKWSGEILVPMDSIAFIGRAPWGHDNIYLVTGDSGTGMTYGTIAGMLISDLITGKENEWEKIYKPSRFTLKASRPFFQTLKGDFEAMVKKWFFKDGIDLSSIKNGEAKLIELEGEKCGVYRDKESKLHIVSAECTHLGCLVAWNCDEKSWDCPCHGSRFTCDGKVINGPANADLHAYGEHLVHGD